MWSEFYLAVAVSIAYLFIPGFLFFRGMSFSPLVALCCAPLYGTLTCSLLPIVYYPLGIPCTIASIVGPTIVAAAILFALARMRGTSDSVTASYHGAIVIAYVLIAVAVCHYAFVSHLSEPYVVNCQYDNQTHINVTRSFLDSGNWSTLHKDSFSTSAVNERPYAETDSFYPCAWHDLAALTCLLANTSVPIATNALVVTLADTVFPLGMFLLLQSLFPGERRTITVGAIITSGFSTWPWVYVIKGPRYPNMLGICLLVSVLAVIVRYIEEKQAIRRSTPFVAFCFLSFFVLAVAHPNTLFTAYVMLAPYGAHVILRALSKRHIALRSLSLALFWAVIVGFWYLLYQLPFFSSVLGYRWSENVGLLRALSSLLALRLVVSNAQIAMCVACLFGVFACIHKKRLWLLAAPTFFSICFVATRMGWETIKYWLAGVWYQSPDRFTANITICTIPIASLGMSTLVNLVEKRIGAKSVTSQGSHMRTASGSKASSPALIAVLTVAVFCLVNYLPSFTIPVGDGILVDTSYGYTIKFMARKVSTGEDQVYSLVENDFVEQAKEVIPDDALVLNQPNDGSMYAYGANELKTYYRSTRGDAAQTDDAKNIRLHLDEYATNPDVRNAVERTGAKYLLLLDKGATLTEEDKGRWIYQYRTEKAWEQWEGINKIDDDTPGFEVVLAEGDEMRLYRIVGE